MAQYPHLVTPDGAVVNALAPGVTLRLLIRALGGVGAIILLPSLAFLFHIFQGKKVWEEESNMKQHDFRSGFTPWRKTGPSCILKEKVI